MTLVFDCGYSDYRWWLQLTRQKAREPGCAALKVWVEEKRESMVFVTNNLEVRGAYDRDDLQKNAGRLNRCSRR
jgi:hypothetical protein